MTNSIIRIVFNIICITVHYMYVLIPIDVWSLLSVYMYMQATFIFTYIFVLQTSKVQPIKLQNMSILYSMSIMNQRLTLCSDEGLMLKTSVNTLFMAYSISTSTSRWYMYIVNCFNRSYVYINCMHALQIENTSVVKVILTDMLNITKTVAKKAVVIEHRRTSIMEVMGSNPIWSLRNFSVLSLQLLYIVAS